MAITDSCVSAMEEPYFESPRRLGLRVWCKPEKPARDTLDVWPTLPIIVAGYPVGSSEMDNIIPALEQSDRVCRVDLIYLGRREWQKVLGAMQVPFPELTYLQLWSTDETPPVLPDSFLGGSAPRLRYLALEAIPSPGLPTLLLSATHLVSLSLDHIPDSGSILPEAMVALLSALSSLRTLSLEFKSPESRPDWETRTLHPSERSILPALKNFRFKGVSEYLEDFVTIVDTPRLEGMNISFINRIDFDCPRLAQFINRTPKLGKSDEAHVVFSFTGVRFHFGTLLISILNTNPDWRHSSVLQLCNSSLPSTVEDLYIQRRESSRLQPVLQNENTLWLQLLLSFTAVKNLYLSREFGPVIAATLQKLVGARITGVLPSLQNIFVRGLEPSRRFQENTRHFVAARQHSNRPIAISVWDNNSYKPM